MENVDEKKKVSFTQRMRGWFAWYLTPIAKLFIRLGVPPNTVTLFGLAGNIGGALLISLGHMTWAGIVLLLMAPIDAVDGLMARLRGMASDWGGFVDSVTDRYAELFIFLGFIIYYLKQGNELGVALAYLASAGSILVSYIKARADASKLDADVGFLTRVERYLVIIPALIFNLPMVSLWIITIFANLTALQRILQVRRDASRRLSQP